MLSTSPNWDPFLVRTGVRLAPRPLLSSDGAGIGDRLRAAAFAELQAEAAFLWAAERFSDAPQGLRKAWRMLAREERKHLGWLLKRMEELRQSIQERPVSDDLWKSLIRCETAREFAHYIADAEERGRKAGERFCEALAQIDATTADIFGRISFEERGHIALAYRFFPRHLSVEAWLWSRTVKAYDFAQE